MRAAPAFGALGSKGQARFHWRAMFQMPLVTSSSKSVPCLVGSDQPVCARVRVSLSDAHALLGGDALGGDEKEAGKAACSYMNAFAPSNGSEWPQVEGRVREDGC
ncbi:hypothetical protein GQ54DRAFT_161927 [Martensiomyces pterosporus]|nr:hypothetical protein GQ54DRAFT_161927 [Martensiomyces pterosporus]